MSAQEKSRLTDFSTLLMMDKPHLLRPTYAFVARPLARPFFVLYLLRKQGDTYASAGFFGRVLAEIPPYGETGKIFANIAKETWKEERTSCNSTKPNYPTRRRQG